MEDQAIGWIAAIFIGAIAGWLAEQVMKSQMGLLMNILLGIVGAAVASWLFGLVGISFGRGWLGYLVAGFIGESFLFCRASHPRTDVIGNLGRRGEGEVRRYVASVATQDGA
jgi:uncharacterized membrane protein YeaQ/YmgE (transglycosylase-associated protein family)